MFVIDAFELGVLTSLDELGVLPLPDELGLLEEELGPAKSEGSNIVGSPVDGDIAGMSKRAAGKGVLASDSSPWLLVKSGNMLATSLPFPPNPKSGIICWLGANAPPKRSSNNSPVSPPLVPNMSCIPLGILLRAASGLSTSANIELLAIAKSTVPDVYVADGVVAERGAYAGRETGRALVFGAAN